MKFDKKLLLLIGLVVILLLVPMMVTRPYFLHVIIMCLLWAYLASSWNIIGGFAGQLSLGHGIYTATGAYVTMMLFNTFGISPWLGLFVGGAAAVLISVLIGFPTFGLRGAYYALATVAISEGIVVIINSTHELGPFSVGGAEGLIVKMVGDSAAALQFSSKIPYYYLILFMLFLVIAVSYWIKTSKLGYCLIALKEDEDAAAAMGINVRNNKLIAAMISAFMTALGGVFYAVLIRYLEPNAIAGGSMSTQMVFLSIVGGSGTILGPVIGGILLSLISEVIRFYLGGQLMGLHLFIYGVIVLLVIMYQPRGIVALLGQIVQRFSGPKTVEGGVSGVKDSGA